MKMGMRERRQVYSRRLRASLGTDRDLSAEEYARRVRHIQYLVLGLAWAYWDSLWCLSLRDEGRAKS